VEEVGSSGKVSLKVMRFSPSRRMPSRRTLGSCHQGKFSVVPSRRVPSRQAPDLTIMPGIVKVDSGSCCQGGCGLLKSASTSLRVQILFMAVVAAAVRELVVLDLSVPHGRQL